MRGDQRLGRREQSDARRRRPARSWIAVALGVVFALAGTRAEAADRPDLRSPEASPAQPELEPAPEPPSVDLPAPEVTLFWFDPKGLLPSAFERVSSEVNGIFREVGVRTRWQRGGSETVFGDGARVEIPVILLPTDPAALRASRRVMGLVPKKPEGRRVVWAFLDNVRWTLGHDARVPISPRQQGELGLALARVVAHEVVHAVAPDEPHTNGGLMHHSMDRNFLLGEKAPLEPGCARAFLRSLAELVAPVPPASAHAGPERATLPQ